MRMLPSLFLALSALGTVDTSFAQAQLLASNPGGFDEFGRSVALAGDTAIVGAPYEDGPVNPGDNSFRDAGAAYVFVRQGTVWTQQAVLRASNAGPGDELGWSVAVSGDIAVVGAPFEDSEGVGNPSDDSARSSGAAYVFVRSGTVWSQQAFLKAANAGTGDQFGFSVALSGNSIVVGAPFEDSDGASSGADNRASGAGAAYVFAREGEVWNQHAFLKASNAEARDQFGIAVAMSGGSAVITALNEASDGQGNEAENLAFGAGAAYVFARDGTDWFQQAFLKASNAEAQDKFGTSVALSADTAIVGASGEDGNGKGSPFNNSAPGAGAAYVFMRSGTSWVQQGYLKASDAQAGDGFGFGVSASGDNVVIGAPYQGSSSRKDGAAYGFARSGGSWSLRGRIRTSNPGQFDEFGYSVALSGGTMVIGARDSDGADGTHPHYAGAAYVYPVPDQVLHPITSIIRTANGMRLTNPGTLGRGIGLEYSPDLTHGTWLDLGNFYDSPEGAEFIDPDPVRAARPSGFYRAFLRPPPE